MTTETQEATPSGVEGVDDSNIEDPTPAPAEEESRSPRQVALDDIAENAKKMRDGYVEEESIDPPAEDLDPVLEDPAEDPEPEELELEPEPEVEMVTIKVDGQSREVPLSEIRDAGVRTLQKESAADKRLAEATEIQRQASEMLRQAQTPVLLPTPSAPADAEELKAAAKKFSDAIFSGEEDATQAAIEDVMKLQQVATPQTPSVSAEEISSMVQATVQQEESRRELASAQLAFAKDFPDIDSDPDLKELANIKTIAIQQEHPEWTPGQVISKAGEEVMSKIKSTNTPDNSEVLESRRQRKRSATPPPSAAARAPQPKEQKPPTRKDVVAEMQSRRAA